ncbi:hypothetical protein AQS8620_01227 [Aquimixticola soesokkakensis]|uniref:YjiS-like domain-containing protein n=1 Tax=Aquimixticola soesokkakensis TaxID=1519096 RepID=A0A1Y5SAX6_9RHOB|nr:DUF1127 domain-containing protein [Aquimixticola soesokkakensis]SLN35383.1 hypothetical protein AQS8620_01227 [Aquimixticola soesokkakensis]
MAYASNIRTVETGLRLPALFKGLGERFARYQVYRSTLNELNTLSTRELADLGISAANVRAIAYQAAYGE